MNTITRLITIARPRSRRLVYAVGAAVLALAAPTPAAWADMSIGRNTAAYDGDGPLVLNDISTLATVTITKVRRHTVILVDATVSDIDPGVDTQIYLWINGVGSGPVAHCTPTAKPCSLSFHRPIDADERQIGMPMTLTLAAYTPSSDTSVQVGFTAHVVKK
jgi:hypothetical protein